MSKGDSVEEILNLDVSLTEMVVITLLVAFNIAIWDQLCCSLGEFDMRNGCR